jgi:ABC-type lipoprotein release transport system permease subunit
VKLLLQLSTRNLLRHKRRNGMLLLAIAVAVAGVNATNSLLRGYQFDLLDSAVANLTGHVKVLAPGYRDDPSIAHGFIIDDTFVPDVPVEQVLGWAPRLRIPAVIMSERETRGVQLVGIDPQAESISFLQDASVQGEFLSNAQDKRVMVGKELARQLETAIGRRLVIITQGADGLNRERGYRVAGTYDAEGTSLEKLFVFVGLQRLQELLNTEAVTEISVRLTDEAFRENAKLSMVEMFRDLEVMDWQELEPQAAEMFLFADSVLFIWFILMMGALTFGLVNSLVAAVMERVKELGMMRALGMQKRTVVAQVVIESCVMMAAGVVAGTLLGAFIYLSIHDGIDLSDWSQGAELFGVTSVLVPVMLPGDLLSVAWMSMVLGMVASLYPAWRVVKIRPLDALRS